MASKSPKVAPVCVWSGALLFILLGTTTYKIPWMYLRTYEAAVQREYWVGLKKTKICENPLFGEEECDPVDNVGIFEEAGDDAWSLCIAAIVMTSIVSFFMMIALCVCPANSSHLRHITIFTGVIYLVSSIMYASAAIGHVNDTEDEGVCDMDTIEECGYTIGYIFTWTGMVLQLIAAVAMLVASRDRSQGENRSDYQRLGGEAAPAYTTVPTSAYYPPPTGTAAYCGPAPGASSADYTPYVPPPNPYAPGGGGLAAGAAAGGGMGGPGAPSAHVVQQSVNVVRCTHCQILLQVPLGVNAFTCPCGNVMRSPDVLYTNTHLVQQPPPSQHSHQSQHSQQPHSRHNNAGTYVSTTTSSSGPLNGGGQAPTSTQSTS